MDNESNNTLDLGAFDFTPAWAKKDAGVVVGKTRPVREAPERGPSGAKPPRKDFQPRDRKQPGRPQTERDRERSRWRESERLPVFETTILPETKALGTVIRKLQQDFHAYKLKDLAYFFLDNPSSVLLKIVPAKPAEGTSPQEKPPVFHQCKSCSFASVSEQDVVSHILSVHLGDYFEARETETEPPKGNFNCVAKCGLSGELLGPPNIHEFNSIVREMIRTRYPGMSESEYRSRITMVRDQESIEAWRAKAVKKTVYVRKGAGEDAAPVSREQAEAEFRRTVLPSMIDTPKTLMISAAAALSSPMRALQNAAKAALENERRAPYKMCFALRGAFHHRKMHFFRTNDSKGQEFVSGHEFKEFDSAHAIPELAKIADFIKENPCSPKIDIVKSPEDEKHLAWLVSTGHIVAFTNGVFSAVEKYPKYGPQWQRRKKKAAPAAEDTSVAEAVDSAQDAEKAADGADVAVQTQDESNKEMQE